MSDNETNKTIGADGLLEFGEYLACLAQPDYRGYKFEIPGESGPLRECSLDDVLTRFREFCDRKMDMFRVCITYVDYRQGTLGYSDRTLTRHTQ